MQKLSLVLLFFIGVITIQAQTTGKVVGKIIDAKTGETLPGASILLEGTTQGASSDFDGNYTINSIKPGVYTVVCKYVSYSNKAITGVEVKAGDFVTVNFSMEEPVGDTLGEVTITATLNKENTNTVLIMQKNNASVSDGISAETIRKSPNTSTSDVLRRVSGAAIQDNKFAVVRGLNDRYNAAFLNGAVLPSSESDRKAFAFDIFPANMLDNLVINKTATPDMPAEFAGGLIFINTKSIPEKNFQSLQTSIGFNSITTGNDKTYYKGGKYDWLGIDDGTRNLPGEIPSQKDFPVNIHKQASLAKYMKNDWALYSKKYSPNANFQYTLAQSFKRKEKDFLGMIVALTYNRSNSIVYTERNAYTSSIDLSVPSQIESQYFDKAYTTQTLAGAIANFSLKLNDKNSIGFKNIYSVNSDDRVILRTGNTNPLENNPTLLRSNARWFTENRIYSGQLSGEHMLSIKHKIKLEWIGSYSQIQRKVPDLRRSVYTRLQTFNDPSDPIATDTVYQANIAISSVGPSYGGGVFNSKTKENIKSARVDISKPFELNKNNKIDVKAGLYEQMRSRDFAARQMGYTKYSVVGGAVNFKDSLLYLPEEQIFANQNMGLLYPGAGGFKLVDATKPTDKYHASSDLFAGYIMGDYRFKEYLRIIGGVRYESFNQKLNANYDNGDTVNINSFKNDFLPSLNAVYSLTKKQNIRASYSQTLNRPEFRELATFAFYDFNTNFLVSGNDKLVRAKIHNADLRYEFYPGRGQILSVTGFYKKFINPIEQVSIPSAASEIYYANVPEAVNKGFELEMRVILGALLKTDSSKLLNNLTIYANYAYINSKVILSNNSTASIKSRQLQGQSPYIVNTGIIYQDDDLGYSISIAANRVGQRIAIVGNVNEPDIWENGRTVIDIQAGKSFFKNKLEIRATLKDLLAEKFYYLPKLNNKNLKGDYIEMQKQYFYQDRNSNNKLDKKVDDLVWISNFGRVLTFSISYKF